MLPNFIIGGAPVAGTSFLISILMQHPNIYLPRKMRPEPHFFYYSNKYEKGINWYASEWFSDHKNEKAVGERSSSYLYKSICAERIKKFIPDTKLIFVLRNPIERAWANYRFSVLSGLETLSFSDALKYETARISKLKGIWSEVKPFAYAGRGFYGKQMKSYLKLFDLKKILIISSEKLNNDTSKQLLKITDFLEIEPIINFKIPPIYSAMNVINAKLQSELRTKIGETNFDKIIEFIRSNKEIDKKIHSSEFEDHVHLVKKNLDSKKSKISTEIKEKLSLIYKQDINLLFELIRNNVDFEPWV